MKHKGFDKYKGYDVQNDFIQEDHHTNPRRLYSRTGADWQMRVCLLYTSPSPRDLSTSRMPSSA